MLKFYAIRYILSINDKLTGGKMFGYVNVYSDELKVREYKEFKAYYCGLCRALGRRCSQISRFGLSYDMTFLAIVLSSAAEKKSEYKKAPCIAHPVTKRTSVINDDAVDYAADVSVILFYLKLADDWHDEKSIRALFGMASFYTAYKKACGRHPNLAESIKRHLSDLSELEEKNSADTDLCADCFAKITEELFSPDFVGENKRQAAWLGYNIGRWIYVIDAISDMGKDFKKKSFNPYLAAFKGGDIKQYILNTAENSKVPLTFTLENAASAYELMKLYRNKEIIENILYISLPMRQDMIIEKLKECSV